jgi:hypothetical protein
VGWPQSRSEISEEEKHILPLAGVVLHLLAQSPVHRLSSLYLASQIFVTCVNQCIIRTNEDKLMFQLLITKCPGTAEAVKTSLERVQQTLLELTENVLPSGNTTKRLLRGTVMSLSPP